MGKEVFDSWERVQLLCDLQVAAFGRDYLERRQWRVQLRSDAHVMAFGMEFSDSLERVQLLCDLQAVAFRKTLIIPLELIALAGLMFTFAPLFAGRDVLFFIDDQSVRAAL